LFGILGGRIELVGARVLDLYAGTGALALEALSRGAVAATVVERARDALAVLRANVESLDVTDQVRVVAGAVERAASGLAGSSFDLVFVDPPYADVTSGVALRALEAIVAAGVLAEGAMVVLEHAPLRGQAGERSEEGGPSVSGLARVETRRYGDTCLSFFAREGV
jgi:16S rRNA (guanine966-N2)-methyltransferase